MRDLYGYEVSDADAEAVAQSAGAMLALAGHLPSTGLAGIEPPFGYPVLLGEATRLAKARP